LTHVDVRSNARMRVFRDFIQASLESKRALVEGGTVSSRPA